MSRYFPFVIISGFIAAVCVAASGAFAGVCSNLCYDHLNCEKLFVTNEWRCYHYEPNRCKVLWSDIGSANVDCYAAFDVTVFICDSCGEQCSNPTVQPRVANTCASCTGTASIPLPTLCEYNPGS